MIANAMRLSIFAAGHNLLTISIWPYLNRKPRILGRRPVAFAGSVEPGIVAKTASAVEAAAGRWGHGAVPVRTGSGTLFPFHCGLGGGGGCDGGGTESKGLLSGPMPSSASAPVRCFLAACYLHRSHLLEP